MSHTCRKQALYQIVGDGIRYAPLGEQTRDLVIIDWYGRDNTIGLPHREEEVEVYIHPHRPEVFAGDLARAPATNIAPIRQPDIAMAVDIYQYDDAWTALTPEGVAVMAASCSSGVCYLVHHDLREPYGCDVFRASMPSEDGTRELTSVEGSWETVGGMVSFKPDATTKPYPLHPFTDWFSTGVHDVANFQVGAPAAWLHVHPMSSVGPYRITKCVLSDEQPRAVQRVAHPRRRYQQVPEIVGGKVGAALVGAAKALVKTIPGWESWSGFDEAQTRNGFISLDGVAAYYDAIAFESVSTLLAHKPLNGRVMQMLVAEATAAVKKGGAGPGLARYPGVCLALATNTVLYACLNRVEAAATEALAASIAADESSGLTADRDTLARGKAPPSFWGMTPYVVFALAGVVAAYLYWKRRGKGGAGPLSYIRGALARNKTDVHLTEATVGSFKATVEVFSPSEGPFLESAAAKMLHTPSHYIGTAVEEVFKYATGWYGGPALALIEALPAIQSNMPWREALTMRGPATALHLASTFAYKKWGAKAMPACIAGHWAFNWIISYLWVKTPLATNVLASSLAVFEEWREAWCGGGDLTRLEGKDELEFRLRAFPATTDFQKSMQDWRAASMTVTRGARVECPFLWTASRVQEASAEYSYGDCYCHHAPVVGEECWSCTYAPETSFSYPLMLTSGALYQPEKTPWSTIVCQAARDFVDPFGWYENLQTEAFYIGRAVTLLKPSVTLLADLFEKHAMPHQLATKEECVAAMGGYKGRALEAAWEQADLTGVVDKTAGQVKYNETLKASRVGENGVVQVKPRAVKNVDTTLQTHILPVARMLAKTIKEVFDGRQVYQIGKYLVRIVVAHATPDEMQRYAELLLSGDLVILISCDDTFVAFGRYSAEFGKAGQETDYTSYDQSQHRGFWLADRMILGRWWNDSAWWSLHDRINNAPVRGKCRSSGEVGADFDRTMAVIRCSMRTGVGTTSDFGSLHNVEAHVYWLLTGPRPFADSCAELGLVAKVQDHVDTCNGGTFLKGFFWDGTWNVVPSASLKLGKLMRNPAKLLKAPVREASEAMFAAIMSSVDVPADYPILGAMRTLSRRLIRAADRVSVSQTLLDRASSDPMVIENLQYKVRSARCSRLDCLRFMLFRYKVTQEDVERAERLILSVSTLPALVADPVFIAMRDVDYE